MAGFNYNRLFNARMVHPFFVSGISKKDLAVLPTRSTAIAMKNSNLLFKKDDEGFRVLYKVKGNSNDDGVPFVPFTNVPLTFAVQLINTNEFLNFTNLTGYTPGKLLYFTNRANPVTSVLTLQFLDLLRPSVFTYQFPQIASGPSDTGTILIKNQAGATVVPLTNVAPSGTSYFYPVDFSLFPKGLYSFETTAISGAQTKTVYIDTDLAATGAFGIIDLLVPSYTGLSASRTYDLTFSSRLTQWKYFIVLQSGGVSVSDTVTIADDGGAQFPYGALSFGAATDTTINNIATKVISTMEVNIPFYEIPKRKLSILKNAEPAVTNIPGPTINLLNAKAGSPNITEIYVYI